MKNYIIICLVFLGFVGYAQNNGATNYPLHIFSAKNSQNQLLFYISGDGGLNSFSKNLANALNNKGYVVVVLDSKKFFWDEKTPQKIAADFNNIINVQLKNFDKETFTVIGYSFGADALPFVVNRLNNNLTEKLESTILLAPSASTDLLIKMSDMLGFNSKKRKYDVLAEINKMNVKSLVVFGKDDDNEIYSLLKEKKNLKKTIIPGSHKFNEDTDKIASTIIGGL